MNSGTRPDEESRRAEALREIRRRDIAALGVIVGMGLLAGAVALWLIFGRR